MFNKFFYLLIVLFWVNSCQSSSEGDFPRVYAPESYTKVKCENGLNGYRVKFRTGKDIAQLPGRYSFGLWCPENKKSKNWLFRSFDDKGNKIDEGKFLDGKQHGLWIGWHKNGAKESEGYFEKGMPIGRFTMWHDNGTVAVTGEYSYDWKPDGKWVYTDSQGRIERIVIWNKGSIVSRGK